MMIATGITAAAIGIPGAGSSPEQGVASSGKRAETSVELRVKRHALTGDTVKVSGQISPEGTRWVTIRGAGEKVKTVRTKRDGAFRARWDAPRAGVYELKAVAQRTYRAERARSGARRVNVYRAAQASYYGPGLYGNGTACGQTLTPSTLGVANRTLPCGTKVTFRHRGNTVRVPVIDRGPFAGDREWDLTAATKAKLGFGSTGVVFSTR